MKVRKLAVALALVGGLGSGMANALGLGEVELQSYLNEPLDADIALRNTGDVGPKEVFVNLASPDVFNRVGISRDFFLTNLQFEVSTAANGQLVVHVTTKQPVREPYLNFLIEVTWPSGKLLREYSMLLDPPVYADRQSGGEPVSAPRTSAAPQPSRQQAQQPTSRPSPARSTSGSSQSTGESYGDTFGPTGPADTLWGIALQVRPDSSYTPQRVMLALQDQNPDAFIDGNINRLKRGQVLRIPTAEQIESRTNQQAYREVVAQNKAFNQPAPSLDATGQQPENTASGSQQDGDELRLSASSDDTLSAAEGGSAGGDEGVAGGADGSSVAAMEQLDKTQRENEELNTRVQDLESQLETMQRLVELKNNQLAEMQGQASETADSDVASADEAGTASAPESADSDLTSDETGIAASADDMSSDMNAEGTVDEDAADDTSESAMTGEEGAESATDEMGADTESADAMAPVGEADQSADSDSMEPEAEEGMAATDAPAMTEEMSEPAAEPEPAPVEVEEAPKSKGFFGDLFDQLKSNTLYQVVAGGIGILVLLLLALLARRNANREKAFYDQLNSESDHESETIDLDADDYGTATEEEKDALAEANAYIAYGRLDQASEVLESAISREPSRTDLRLKLLSVYAVGGDRDAFERQYGELEVLEDDAALAEADVLKNRLAETESTPSIDELESQLRSESTPTHAPAVEQEDGIDDTFASLDNSTGFGSDGDRSEANELDSDSLDGLDLDEDLDLGTESLEGADALEEEKTDSPIEYDISDLDLESADSSADAADEVAEDKEESLDIDFTLEEDLPEPDEESTELSEEDFGSLDLDESMLDEPAPATDSPDHATSDDEELPSLEDDESALVTDGEGKIDESFLDDLDAELDKVANEPDDEASSPEADELDELELDVSDDDLALMDEMTGDDDAIEEGDVIPDLDKELGLEDSLLEDEASAGSDDLDADLDDLDVPELTPAEESAAAAADKPAATELDEAAIDDEDDFDFLAGTDEAATKLDLARAYIEMGDADGARDILEEVAIEGSEAQKTEAQELLKNIS
ncbi:FimV/HubP family polar landmark protein [Marinobacter sp. 1Y8]